MEKEVPKIGYMKQKIEDIVWTISDGSKLDIPIEVEETPYTCGRKIALMFHVYHLSILSKDRMVKG